MKIALIMNNNSYVGREFLYKMKDNNLSPDVFIIGNFPEKNEIEENRCGGMWAPPSESEVIKGLNVFRFPSLKDEVFIHCLKHKEYDLGIQGGTGIIPLQVINSFKYGILNFHPGDLPLYRGCSAPEWQLYEFASIIATCHLIDEGIDSGPIVMKKKLNVSFESYEHFRASIYPQIAEFVVEVLKKVVENNDFIFQAIPQDETKAVYRKYIGEDKLRELKSRFIRGVYKKVNFFLK